MPRDYADKLAEAMGAGFDSCTARTYAGGSFALRRLRARRHPSARRAPWPRPDPEEDEEEEEETDEEESPGTEDDYEE
jgi:hypothetical protein